jgi:putative cellobiose phosphotransferase
LGGHVGFVDADLFRYTTYSVIRCKDHEVFTSDFVKNWILRNNVELITYRDLK